MGQVQPRPFTIEVPDDRLADLKERLDQQERWDHEEGAYGAIQATRPQTLAYGFAALEQPQLLAADIPEFFRDLR